MNYKYVAKPGRAVTASTRRPTRCTIAAAESSNQELKAICAKLREHGIDTTIHNYEMRAESYERYGGGDIYVLKFKCPGNYLAYLAMAIHQEIKTVAGLVDGINDYWGSAAELVDSLPDVHSIAEHAEMAWYGDGDDYIIHLKNLDTGEVLYEAEEFSDEEFIDDGDDYEDW